MPVLALPQPQLFFLNLFQWIMEISLPDAYLTSGESLFIAYFMELCRSFLSKGPPARHPALLLEDVSWASASQYLHEIAKATFSRGGGNMVGIFPLQE